MLILFFQNLHVLNFRTSRGFGDSFQQPYDVHFVAVSGWMFLQPADFSLSNASWWKSRHNLHHNGMAHASFLIFADGYCFASVYLSNTKFPFRTITFPL